MAAATGDAVSTAAMKTESAARGGANLCFSCFGKIWACLGACFGVFSRQVKKLPVHVVSIMLRVFNTANAVLLACACWFAFQIAAGSMTRFFLATYIGVFSLLLFLFETRVKYTEPYIRRSCGFMFTYSGRAVFLVFLGAITFGMLSDDNRGTNGYTWCTVVGLVTIVNAMFNCFIICSHPGFQAANANPDAPAGGGAAAGNDPSKLTDAQIRAYLQAHPELAAAAVSSTAAQQGGATPSEGVTDWAAGRKEPSAGPAGGGVGGFFGFGRGGGNGGKAKTPKAGDAETGNGGYAPPSAPAPAAAVYSPPAAAYAPPAVPQWTPPTVPNAAPTHVIEEDNPFSGTDNPFDKK